MKTVKDKYLVVGADFAGFPLKEVVVGHLEKKGWKILDLGVKKDSELSLFWGMRGRAVRGDEAAAKWLRERK